MRVPRSPKSPQRAERRVTRAIKITLAHIEEHDPKLGGVLRDGIETGQFLSYTPKSHQKRRKGGSSAKLSIKGRGLKPRQARGGSRSTTLGPKGAGLKNGTSD